MADWPQPCPVALEGLAGRSAGTAAGGRTRGPSQAWVPAGLSPLLQCRKSGPAPMALSPAPRVQVEFYVNENTFKERLKLFFIKNQRSSEWGPAGGAGLGGWQ